MKSDLENKYPWAEPIVGITLLCGFYGISLHNYLLFHSLAEFFSVVIACGIFLIAWNSKNFIKNDYIIFIGTAYFFIAGLDLLHTLSYRGMELFQHSSGNLPTQLWIAARYMESITLLIAPFFVGKNRVRAHYLFSGYLAITILLLITLFYWPVFPDCFIEGAGLTPFKKISEYIISLILGGSLFLLFKKRRYFDPSIFRLLYISILLTICAELSFTFYVSVFDLSNLIGHLFKMISFYLIYRAIIHTGLKTPYSLLFKEIHEKEQALRLCLDAGKAGTWTWDIKTDEVLWDDQMQRNFGLEPGEFKGSFEDWKDRVHPDDIDGAQKAILAALAHGERYQCNYRVKGRAGKWNFINAHAAVIKNASGDPVKMSGFAMDITESKKAEEEIRHQAEKLKASEERYREHFEEDFSGAYLSTTEGQLLECNNEYIRMFGFNDKQHALNTSILDIFKDPDERRDFLNILREKTRITGRELEYNRIDGLPVHVIENASAVLDREGNLHQIRGYLLDITEKRRLESQLHQTQKMETIGTLAGGIAHDFNNMLFPILGHAEILLEDVPEKSPLRESLDEIYTSALRAKALVQKILTFSRQETGELKVLKIQTIVKEALKLIRSTLPTTIDIQQEIDDDCGVVKADPTQIHQILMNLTTNAYHAMETTGGTMAILLRKVELNQANLLNPDMIPGGFVCLSVIDQGDGFDKGIENQIFDPFFTTKEQGKGTGMGLAIVHGIVKNMNGGIKVVSAFGKGTRIDVFFPIYKETPHVVKETSGGI